MALAIARKQRRAGVREATREEILRAAWTLARKRGPAALTLRDLAKAVDMRAPSLYSYFASKHAIYDAMFADGNRRVWQYVQQPPLESDPRQRIKGWMRAFVRFCSADPALYQLLFQRSIPGFEPSRESMELANHALEWGRAALADAGVHDPAGSDMLTAIVSGLIGQQTANDPGGDRWIRLCDDAVQMFFDYFDHRQGGSKHDPDD
ncbi:MAG TPA: TetR/AcrR family transcriptional regulator [Candidatus Dormibacteraeota bacterium]|nr:TetR/AcrR family transcriptional regulator [Candidatus Dormibacteraeota bacterium]